MTIEFYYNGKLRRVLVHKETATYIQGENVGMTERPFSTYLKEKMVPAIELRLPAK